MSQQLACLLMLRKGFFLCLNGPENRPCSTAKCYYAGKKVTYHGKN